MCGLNPWTRQHNSDEPTMPMNATHDAIDDVVAEAASARKSNWGRRAVVAGILLGGLAASAAADMSYMRPTFDNMTQTWNMGAFDDNFYYGLSVSGDASQNLFGDGGISLYNIQGEGRNAFDIGFIEAALQLPGGWSSSYDNDNNILHLTGNVLAGDSYNINFTFDPTNVAFGRTDFVYRGFITEGVMPDVDTLERTQVVPLPGAGLLALFGFGTAAVGLRKRKNLL